ncbi:type I-C CRISPR-associated protein Cas8c/Csd1 [Salinispira pacifica]|uniref:CRISPR-associated protein, CT1133 family n=1 Tax=Salinispira pacifica TaxID=1307761 RepID=V5WDZ2_9SPIO|nr:type I-C CRISPR-associated protein Cas8c/Csd1 [Salinispira pacifica]AHC14002.1 CRISPR-associated protein, CT1133 family [Salinispira pacifica]
MIIQALYEYYQRKADDPNSNIPPEGFERKQIPFLIVLDKQGNLVRFEDTRETGGGKNNGKPFLVPQGEKKTSGIKANLLWDSAEYVLGITSKQRNNVQERHHAFIEKQSEMLSSIADKPQVKAVMNFLNTFEAENYGKNHADSVWDEIYETNPNLTFKLQGEAGSSITESLMSDLKELKTASSDEFKFGRCMVTGEKGLINRIHPAIKGVYGAQKAGAALVSFQKQRGYDSYCKEQNFNAPISKTVTFAYTTALNLLLAKGSRNRLQIGDTSVVFWAQKSESNFEKHFPSFFTTPKKERDNPDKDIEKLSNTFYSVLTGIPPEEKSSKFYILGLAPNAARISVRFWHEATVEEFANNIRQHLMDLEIEGARVDEPKPSLSYLLKSTVLDWKSDNVPPNLAGNMMRSVLNNQPYPVPMLHQCIRRIRAEQKIYHIRAALLKAYLNRKERKSHNNLKKEIKVALDKENTNVGYRLGRLFAALEKIQEDASGGRSINSTIRERYYSSASSNPVTAFPQLLKLKNYHLAKIDNPAFKTVHEKRLAEIMGELPTSIPAHMNIEDQARFAIGYYHQRQDFFKKNNVSEGENNE